MRPGARSKLTPCSTRTGPNCFSIASKRTDRLISRAPSQDKLMRQKHARHLRLRFAQALEEQMRGRFAEFLHRLRDGGERRIDVRGHGDVVEADDRHVL